LRVVREGVGPHLTGEVGTPIIWILSEHSLVRPKEPSLGSY